MRPLGLALAVSLSLASVAACSGARGGGATEGAPDARASRVYASKCSACHRPYEPASRTRAEWQAAVARMAPRAHLRDDERALVLEYLEAHARDARAAP